MNDIIVVVICVLVIGIGIGYFIGSWIMEERCCSKLKKRWGEE